MANRFHREPLVQLYRRVIDDRNLAIREEVQRAIALRSQLGARLFAPKVAGSLNSAGLDFAIECLDTVQAANPAQDPAADAAEREIVRVQLEVLQRERERRMAVWLGAQRGDLYLPVREELDYWVQGIAARVLGHVARDAGERLVSVVTELVRQIVSRGNGDVGDVVRLLREVARISPDAVHHPIRSWLPTAIALELLIVDEGYAGRQIIASEKVRDAARRAWRLFYHVGRSQDNEEVRLDLTGEAIADLLEGEADAMREWSQFGMPSEEIGLYTDLSRREEPGRPTPHPQVVPEASARAMAERAGAFPQPLLLAVPPINRATMARSIWCNGLPRNLGTSMGLTLYPSNGDPRVAWGAPPHPYGLLCAVALPANFILHVGDDRRRDDHARFDELSRQATARSWDPASYTRELSALLRREGIYAVAQHDPIRDQINEVTLLDPTPETVMVIRESFPPFSLEREVCLTTSPASHTALSR